MFTFATISVIMWLIYGIILKKIYRSFIQTVWC
jgi:uncharacterized protein with PQ loop repeat